MWQRQDITDGVHGRCHVIFVVDTEHVAGCRHALPYNARQQVSCFFGVCKARNTIAGPSLELQHQHDVTLS